MNSTNSIPHELTIDNDFAKLLPEFSMVMIKATVVNSPYNASLQEELDRIKGQIATNYTIPEIKDLAPIQYTRNAYKVLGKDPNRYRPASEQLYRRILKGDGIYKISTLVDFGNLLSLTTGFSVGVFDATCVQTNITLRRGKVTDYYEGIGRGILNVDGLPLYVDDIGPFANPTSDSERTKVRNNTTEALIFINCFVPKELGATIMLQQATDRAKQMLINYLQASNIACKLFSAS